MLSKRVIIMIISLISCAPLSAQDFELSCQMAYGGNSEDKPVKLVKTLDGGYFVLSSSYSPASGNKSCQGFGEADYWLIKTDSLFNNVWQLTYGGDSFDVPYNMLQDQIGNIYLCGYSSSTISGNKTVESYGYSSYWVIKLDQNGNELWQRAYGGDDDEVLTDALMFDNKVYLLGHSSSDSTGVKTGFNRGGKDYWLVCTDTAGNKLWDKTFGGTGFDSPISMVMNTVSNQLYIAGYSSSNASYEKTEDNTGYIDLWLLSVDPSDGIVIADKTIGSNGNDYAADLVLTNNFLFILSGSDGDISGYKTDSCRGLNDYWLIKADLDLNLQFDVVLGGYQNDVPEKLSIFDDNILIGGRSLSDAGFEKSEDAYGDSRDAWLIALETNGNVLWDKTIGSYSSDDNVNFFKDSTDLVVCMASYEASNSGDYIASSYGHFDNWLFRMSVPLSGVEESVSELNASLYPNPATSQIHVQLPDARKAELSLYSLSGKLLMKESLEAPHGTFNVSTLKSGMYMVEVRQNNTLKRAKLVVE